MGDFLSQSLVAEVLWFMFELADLVHAFTGLQQRRQLRPVPSRRSPDPRGSGALSYEQQCELTRS